MGVGPHGARRGWGLGEQQRNAIRLLELAMALFHLITPEFPPMIGGVSEHSRVVAQAAAARGLDVHVWSARDAGPMPGIHVHNELGSFGTSDLARADSRLNQHTSPRRLILQWVPHGYGRRGMNVGFSRWIAGRRPAGDLLDVIVHEPFMDYFGSSWMQPARALVQRSMARTVLRSARRVWMAIPGWEGRLLPMLRSGGAPLGILPVPGTIPVARNDAAVADLRTRLLCGRTHVVGYFGAGGEYAEDALLTATRTLQGRHSGLVFLCLGQGSERVAERLGHGVAASTTVIATGVLDLVALSQHLQSCDVLLHPYIDGVSGRRTTTISALEHGVPVATTFGPLSEPFWRTSPAVEAVDAAMPQALADAVLALLDPSRNSLARSSALTLYAARFAPAVALEPLFAD
jgi:Glycosyl transferases group 1